MFGRKVEITAYACYCIDIRGSDRPTCFMSSPRVKRGWQLGELAALIASQAGSVPLSMSARAFQFRGHNPPMHKLLAVSVIERSARPRVPGTSRGGAEVQAQKHPRGNLFPQARCPSNRGGNPAHFVVRGADPAHGDSQG